MAKCKTCNDTGWIMKEVKGKTFALRCECYDTVEVERLREEANMPPRYINNRLSNYRANNQQQIYAKNFASNFVEEYPFVDYGIFFIGPCGVGKTHLASAILNEIIEKGYEGKFCDFGNLLVQIKSSYNPASRFSEVDIFSELFRAPLLIIDDFASQRVTDWVLDTLTYLIKGLYNEKRILILTTTVQTTGMKPDVFFDQLTDKIGHIVTSRLYEMCQLITIEAADYRKEFSSAHHRLKTKKNKRLKEQDK